MSKATDFLEDEIEKTIDYLSHEFDISYAELIGVLTMKAHDLSVRHSESYLGIIARKEETEDD